MNIAETNTKNPVLHIETSPLHTETSLPKCETTTNKVALESLSRELSFSSTASSSDFSDNGFLKGNHNFSALLDANETGRLVEKLETTFLHEIKRMHPETLATIVVENYPQALLDFFLDEKLKNALIQDCNEGNRTSNTVKLERELFSTLQGEIEHGDTSSHAHDQVVVERSILLSLKGKKLREDDKGHLIRILKELSHRKGGFREKLKAGVKRHLTKTLKTIDLQSLQNFESNLENAKPDQKAYTSLKGTFDLLCLGSISKNKKSISERISDSVSRFFRWK